MKRFTGGKGRGCYGGAPDQRDVLDSLSTCTFRPALRSELSTERLPGRLLSSTIIPGHSGNAGSPGLLKSTRLQLLRRSPAFHAGLAGLQFRQMLLSRGQLLLGLGDVLFRCGDVLLVPLDLVLGQVDHEIALLLL